MIYFDYTSRNYFSYETATGVTKNLSKGINASWAALENARVEPRLTWYPQSKTWLAGGRAVLIYDNFDVWQVDPSGIRRPLNLTNSYGVRHSTKFETINEPLTLARLSERDGSFVVLRAFNKRNKEMGFYKMQLDVQKDPVLCTMGQYVYGDWDGYGRAASLPMKARDSTIYIVPRQSATDAPNLFATSDFCHFVRLSDIKPEKSYNWLTSQLLRWKTFDGSYSTGILYKPENFDSTRKYPLILDYYERRSDELHLYITPKFASSRINIAWFVSRGYLVFTPDINYKPGEPGPSAFNAIVSAAAYLARFPWVNGHKMGIQGHSFGGYETDYVVSHTNMFAAACSASGFCDLMSWYAANAKGAYGMFWAERDQGRLITTLWETPDRYVRNSPIFNANRVTTPLLMMNNKSDGNVAVAQGIEFFTALRRLGRRVWMLNYEDMHHSVSGAAAEDYTIRMTQFFDHYLRDAPAPKWMTRPVPFAKKAGNPSYGIDSLIRTPGPGLNSLRDKIKEPPPAN